MEYTNVPELKSLMVCFRFIIVSKIRLLSKVEQTGELDLADDARVDVD